MLLLHNVPVTNFLVMSGQFPIYLGRTSTKQSIKPPVRLKPVTVQLQVYHSIFKQCANSVHIANNVKFIKR